MTDTAAPTERTPRTTEEKMLLRSFARAMWRTELASGSTVEEKKANWSETRRKYTVRATKLMRAMEKEGLGVTTTASA